ncbi:hypothetical protein FG386_003014 [Cryptosporidium ryanae]|uniref:uncharacterized protein n=1 Tax=Cryptosporidium ryanae TaxID=515981 RepID=UPI00351A4C05|nr:hypothetical protein FG386_003014 [Cryptosporidium ryanae]
MSIRRRDDILVIYIKLSLQFLCILGIFALLIKKEWIIGNRENTEVIIYGDLDEFCIRNGANLVPSNILVNLEKKQSIQEKDSASQIHSRIDKGKDLFDLETFGIELDSSDLYPSIYSRKKNDKTRKSISELETSNINNESSKLKKQKRIPLEQDKVSLSFNSIQYCMNYLRASLLKKWYIHPNYLYYLDLLFIFISIVMSLNLVRVKNKWSYYELIIPGLDFASFTTSLINVVQIISVLTPLIDYFEKTNYNTYFSINFIFACISIGALFVVFFLCIGIIHYRYETFIRLKRLEDHIEEIQSSSSFIHIVSNK